MASVEGLELDIAELENLLKGAERTRVKDVLGVEIRKLQTKLMDLNVEELARPAITTKPIAVATKVILRPQHTIKTYGWDQSDKFMKIYVTLNGVHDISAENVKTEFTNKSVRMIVTDLKGEDHSLHISKLNQCIDASQSKHKVKTDMVLLMLKKEVAEKTWPHVTQKEEKPKPAPSADGPADPNAGMMDMLKNMYDDGDDEMKRTIGKAMMESKMKTGGAPGEF